MQTGYSPLALEDLGDIRAFVTQDDASAAYEFLDRLLTCCEDISLAPEAFPERHDLAPGLRAVPFAKYLILYRIHYNTVRIERILHGSRNLPEVDFG